jgi:ferric-dicitrate binding protein FerR (iron transport regulator)
MIDPRRIAAWRQGTLRFDRIPLRDAIRDIERYWTGRILLADPALGSHLRQRGVRATGSSQNFLRRCRPSSRFTSPIATGDMILTAPMMPSVRPQ